jgi:uncharacterized protein
LPKLTLKLIDGHFAIHSLTPNSKIPENVFSAEIFFIAKTYDEVSIVIPQSIAIESDEVEKNWRALEVIGPLDFSLTGILSNISTVLANEKISIFAISTFDTDYILVKENNVSHAKEALITNHYSVI